MTKYMIHTCWKREWYVNEYLIPSMIKQGINRDDILVYVDRVGAGNLKAFLDSADLLTIPERYKFGTWHLQDDVIISSKFKETTERYNDGIVEGFASEYDKEDYYWWSFPCIRIPNAVLADFVYWVRYIAPKNPQHSVWISKNKFDDALFKDYLLQNNVKVIKLIPNIVDHIDYLIGGSIVNRIRSQSQVRSVYWPEEDEHLIMELTNALKIKQ